MEKQQDNVWLVIALLGAGFLMLFAFIFVILLAFLGVEAKFSSGDGIGVVEIVGPIEESKEALKQLDGFARDERVKAVLVRIDSPGGAVGPSQEIHSQILRLRDKKPVAVSFGSVATSGGYYIGCAGQRIFASPGTITGSIGVIIQTAYLADLMAFLKIQPITYKSGKHKDTLSPFRITTEEEKALVQELLDDVHTQFIEDVARARGMEPEAVRALADGRIFTGRKALEAGLVDETGSFSDAVDWLAALTELGDAPTLIYPKREALSYLQKLVESSFGALMKAARQEPHNRVEYRAP